MEGLDKKDRKKIYEIIFLSVIALIIGFSWLQMAIENLSRKLYINIPRYLELFYDKLGFSTATIIHIVLSICIIIMSLVTLFKSFKKLQSNTKLSYKRKK